MSETRWTPGPWRWWTSNSRLRLSSDATGKDGDVLYAERLRDGADVVVPNPADRPLIAAAPVLRDSVVDLLEALSEAVEFGHGIDDSADDYRVQAARRALAAARGEQNDA